MRGLKLALHPLLLRLLIRFLGLYYPSQGVAVKILDPSDIRRLLFSKTLTSVKTNLSLTLGLGPILLTVIYLAGSESMT